MHRNWRLYALARRFVVVYCVVKLHELTTNFFVVGCCALCWVGWLVVGCLFGWPALIDWPTNEQEQATRRRPHDTCIIPYRRHTARNKTQATTKANPTRHTERWLTRHHDHTISSSLSTVSVFLLSVILFSFVFVFVCQPPVVGQPPACRRA